MDLDTLLTVETDTYLHERARVAFQALPSWTVQPISLSKLSSLSLDLVLQSVLLVPVGRLLDLNPRPFPSPVIGVGQPGLFASVPEGLCEDLITGRFTGAELVYRVTKAAAPPRIASGGRQVTCCPFRLDAETRSAELSPSQYGILLMLIRSAGTPVPRTAIAAVAGCNPEDSRSVDMHISRLRNRLREVTGDWPVPPRIVSDRGAGYTLGV